MIQGVEDNQRIRTQCIDQLYTACSAVTRNPVQMVKCCAVNYCTNSISYNYQYS